jgi:molybdopterin molybdotransferase
VLRERDDERTDNEPVARERHQVGDVLFHRVRLRPGKPIAVAELDAHDAVVFAIPGKPVGAHAVSALVAGPFFTGRETLPTVDAEATHDIGIPKSGFLYAIPVSVSGGEATPMGQADSPLSVYEETFDPSVLSSSTRATRSDGYLITETAVSAGDRVEIVPYSALE